MPVTQTPFYFVRHGETEANRKHLYIGSTDLPLNDAGVMQARAAAHALRNTPIKTIVASPLLRAKVTAEIIAFQLDKEVIIIDDLKEFHAGALEETPIGGERSTLSGLEIFQRISQKVLGSNVEGADRYEDFKARVQRAMSQALVHEGPVLVVAHGGVGYALHDLLNIPFIRIHNATPLLHVPPAQADGQWFVHQQLPGESVPAVHVGRVMER